MVSESHDGTARVWNVGTGERTLKIKTRPESLKNVDATFEVKVSNDPE